MKFFSIDTRMTLISSVSRYFPKWYFTKMFRQKRTKEQSERRIKVKTFRRLRVLNVIQATNTITFTGNNNRHSSRTALNPKVLQNRVRVGGERSSQLVLFTLASRVNPQRVKYSTGVGAEQSNLFGSREYLCVHRESRITSTRNGVTRISRSRCSPNRDQREV